MAIKIAEPAVDRADLIEWVKFIERTTVQGGGFDLLVLTNMANSGVPKVQAGSRFELNGVFYKCEIDENITGTPVNNAVNYIYAVPDGDECTFGYGTTGPVFDPSKGGWFNGNNRAVAKLFYTNAGYNGKVILDSQAAMSRLNTEQSIPASGGLLVASGAVNTETQITLQPGAYRFEVAGGTGGNGGTGGTGGYTSGGGGGGAGRAGEVNTAAIVLLAAESLYANTGGNGPNGGDGSGGGAVGGGGGGGGGSSGLSYIRSTRLSIMSRGGPGGGGGGGGGGGNGGTGGAGATGGGVSPGGNGAAGVSTFGSPAAGGSGGAINAEFSLTYRLRNYSNSGGVGSSGSGTGAGGGGAGGSGLQSTSSGYTRIYRLW
jgi:hypothetical protein